MKSASFLAIRVTKQIVHFPKNEADFIFFVFFVFDGRKMGQKLDKSEGWLVRFTKG
ncbi:MAG: hypothetical protein BMS9Abin04_166 [Planctomycetia bacterium]|nr:MAG: hypothetical protein BMS9Abin04_166 [Planctomycetia bacterium]